MRALMLTVAIGSVAIGCVVVTGLSDYRPCDGAECAASGGDSSAADAWESGKGDAPADAPIDGNNPNTPPSCQGLAKDCNKTHDCCESATVPGGMFVRTYDGVPDAGYDDAAYPATISTFDMDIYEVTVGRFRNFLAAYPGNMPAPGSGKNPHDPADPGWSQSWNQGFMAPDAATISNALACSKFATWTKTPQNGETLPINCVMWFEAFAFCVWDGGRLPTDAELNYAAAGGNEQRAFPWSVPHDQFNPDATHLVFANNTGPAVVGSKPLGAGRWGHADLSGNVYEYGSDWWYDLPLPCTDCANHTPDKNGLRTMRGGAFNSMDVEHVRTAHRDTNGNNFRTSIVGVRCVHDR
jgi:sulfatase modifying factor 1